MNKTSMEENGENFLLLFERLELIKQNWPVAILHHSSNPFSVSQK